jgi:hypothetical protein
VPLTDRADGIVAEIGRGGSDEGRSRTRTAHEEDEQFGKQGKDTIEQSFSDLPSVRPIQLAVGLHGCLFFGAWMAGLAHVYVESMNAVWLGSNCIFSGVIFFKTIL